MRDAMKKTMKGSPAPMSGGMKPKVAMSMVTIWNTYRAGK
jgi:ABC-type nitrate/sulfonate/bicarbonate transport system ATPase subunit